MRPPSNAMLECRGVCTHRTAPRPGEPLRHRTITAVAVLMAAGSVHCARSRSASPPPTAPAPAPAAAPDAHEQTATEVLAALKNHDFDAVERHFDGPMQRDVPREKVDRLWSSAVAAKGEMTSWKLVDRDNSAGYDRLRFELDHENGRWQALIIFTAQGSEVAGMFIQPLPAPDAR